MIKAGQPSENRLGIFLVPGHLVEVRGGRGESKCARSPPRFWKKMQNCMSDVVWQVTSKLLGFFSLGDDVHLVC